MKYIHLMSAPLELVLERLSQDLDMQTIFEAYLRLTEADAKACLAYAEALWSKGKKSIP